MLLYKTICVLLSGPQRSGKTTIADMLLSEMSRRGLRSYKYSFAHPIKYIASEFIGWDGRKDEKGRKLLQTLGTDAGRTFNPDCWVRYGIDTYLPKVPTYPFDFLVIDDWRFPNEASYIEENPMYDVVRVNIMRPGTENTDPHESENSLSGHETFDIYLYNSGDLYSALKMSESLADWIQEKFDKTGENKL